MPGEEIRRIEAPFFFVGPTLQAASQYGIWNRLNGSLFGRSASGWPVLHVVGRVARSASARACCRLGTPTATASPLTLDLGAL